MNHKNILVINAGSSSIKAAVYSSSEVIANTQLNNVNPETLLEELLGWVEENTKEVEIEAIGHRIVHGGSTFSGPTLLSAEVCSQLQQLTALDPDHTPIALSIIDSLGKLLPNTKQIACFDTAFFNDLPRVAQILPFPRKFESIGFRKYGFHGLSYQSILETLAEEHSVDVKASRIVCAHLGSGVSLAAIANGEPVDTTMEMTPTSGLPMSTRSGSIDPGIVSFLHKQEGVDAEEFSKIANEQSGLLGVSETSADMYTLLQQESTDIRSKEAVDMFCYQVKKSIGSLCAALGGIDLLVFTGGIGENAPKIRSRICSGLEYFKIHLNEERNQANAVEISSNSEMLPIYVLHTDESLVISKQVRAYIDKQGS